jgi:hypothetical protein
MKNDDRGGGAKKIRVHTLIEQKNDKEGVFARG